MALETNEQFSTTNRVPHPRLQAEKTKPVDMAASAGAELLPIATPVVYDSAAAFWKQYQQPSDAAVYTITAASTAASAGTFQLMIDGLASVHAFDVDAATMQAELQALLADAGKGWSLTCAATTGADLGDNDAVITITFDEAAGAPSVDIYVSGLTGNAHVLAASDAGTQLNGTNEIVGFIYGEACQLSASAEVQATLIIVGEVDRDDINTAAIRAVCGGSPSEAEMDAALRELKLRQRTLIVRNLTKVA